MADFGWPPSTVSEAFEELLSTGFAVRFEMIIFIPQFLRWNGISNPNVASARRKEFDALPVGEAKNRLARAMLEFGKHWSKDFVRVLQICSEGIGKQNPTQPYLTQREPDPPMGGTKPAPADDFDEQFEQFKALYPKRSGDHRWQTAQKHLRARLREGHTWQEILDGVRRYAAWVRHTGKERTEQTKQAASFVGTDKGFLASWKLPRTKADARLAGNIAQVQEAKQRLIGDQQ